METPRWSVLPGARRSLAAICLAPLLAQPLPALAAQGEELLDLSIEELANIQVTSVSRRPERLLDAAASVYVITADDIRRAGAATLPEALRLAPNLQVAQFAGSTYAVTARGLNGGGNSAPNKLLVLIDGRSVYTPLFSGVFWDVQDVLLADIDRIEVISGPGGTLWGVNAVNGIVSITTRSAYSTVGTLARVRAATNGGDAALRHGAEAARGAWRVYGKVQGRDHTERAGGERVDDAWGRVQVGFRGDWARGEDRFSANGNAYRGAFEQPEPGTVTVGGTGLALGTVRASGANLTGGWTRQLERGASLQVQAYVDHTHREVPPAFTQSLTIADLEFQHALAPLGRHEIVWGASYRYSWDRVQGSEVIAFLPARLNQTWASLFAQDVITLAPSLRATVGARIERNDYTGTELLPSARLAWHAGGGHAFWAAASRAVRAPSRIDADAYIPGRPPYLLAGGPMVRAEVARAFELGYRGQPMPGLSYSVALYHNRYEHLRTQELLPDGTISFQNLMEGHANGIEMWGSYQLSKAWRLSAGLTAQHQRLRLKAGSNDEAGLRRVGLDPSHTLQLRAFHSIDAERELELALRKVDALDSSAVPGYTAVDARFGWRLRPGLELSVSGRNLNGGHSEYGPARFRSEIPRTLAVQLTWVR